MRVKVARWGDGSSKAAPEYEDCRAAAQAHGVPLRDVYAAALAAFATSHEMPIDEHALAPLVPEDFD